MSFSVYDEQEIDVGMNDIVNNLSSFSERDLNMLATELSSYVMLPLDKSRTLYDEMKRDALIELNDVLSLDEINELIREKIKR